MAEDSEAPKKLKFPTDENTHRGTPRQHADALEDEIIRIGCFLGFLLLIALGVITAGLERI